MTPTLVLEDFPSPQLARTLSPNGRAHWRVRMQARHTVHAAVFSATDRRFGDDVVRGPIALFVVYVRPTRTRVDLDNLSTGVTKAAIDALVRCGLIDGDDSTIVRRLNVQTRYEKGRRALEITLVPINEGGDAPLTAAALNARRVAVRRASYDG